MHEASLDDGPRRRLSLRDQIDCVPVYVVWEITLACNLRCVHCGSRAGPQARGRTLAPSECLDVVRQLAELGTRQITLIGGEAYLRKDWLIIAKAITRRRHPLRRSSPARARSPRSASAPRSRPASARSACRSTDRATFTIGSAASRAASITRCARCDFANAAGIRPGVNTQITCAVDDRICAKSSMTHRRARGEVLAGADHGGDGQCGRQRRHAAAAPRNPRDARPARRPVRARPSDRLPRSCPGNNIGYFGPLRIHVAHDHQRAGALGRLHGGREQSSGSKPTARSRAARPLPADPYGGGNARDRLDRATRWRRSGARPRPRLDRTPAGGFCGSCYYWNVCRGGCTWVTHGRSPASAATIHSAIIARANWPKKGLRERIVKVAEAPGEPFDFGRFDIVVEDAIRPARPMSELARDDKKRPRGRKLELCTGCREFIFAVRTHLPALRRQCPRDGTAIPQRRLSRHRDHPAHRSAPKRRECATSGRLATLLVDLG